MNKPNLDPGNFVPQLRERADRLAAWARATHDGMQNRWLVYSWALGVLLIGALIARNTTSAMTSYVGIAATRDVGLSFEHAAVIKRVHVIAGQRFSKGDPLVELDQRDLEVKVSNAQFKLAELEAQYAMNSEMSAAYVDGIEGARRKPDKPAAAAPKVGPMPVSLETNPARFEIARVRAELEVLREQKKALRSYAPFDGTVVTVGFAPGETVSPYTPVLTMSQTTPAAIDAYIDERSHAIAYVNQEVTVAALSDPRRSVTGRVLSVGSRIIAFPKRLAAMPSIDSYGREVTVGLPSANPLLVGEKVRVTSSLTHELLFSNAQAGIAGK